MLRLASVAAVVALLAAGCGSSGRPHGSAEHGVPRMLAREWATQASAIAAAASSGNSCHAHALAVSLLAEVVHAGGKVPSRLRSPLLDGLNSLADRIVCTPSPVTVTQPQAPPKPKPPKHPPHRDGHDHGHHGHGGDKGKG